MHPTVALFALLLVGVNSQINLEELFDMNMGTPNLKQEPCLDGRSSLAENSECISESSESVQESRMGDVEGTAEGTTGTTTERTPLGCGYRNVNGVGVFMTAIDEDEAEFGEFPWVVAVLRTRYVQYAVEDIYICSGSLIHPQVVLTAAHNVQTGVSAQYKVRAGEWEPRRQSEDYPHQDRVVSYRIIHPRFHRQNLRYDVALLFLEQPFDLIPSINTICLAPAAQLVDSSPCYVSGWGVKATNREPPSVLKKVELNVRPNGQCEKDLRAAMGPRFALHSSFMCAGGEADKDACLGDGGAPLMCPIANATNRYYQSGLVSWGLGCGRQDFPGVYINVRIVRAWIDEQMAARRLQLSFYTAQ